MISVSRTGPLIVAVAASALLVAGPAEAQGLPSVDPPTCSTTTPPAPGETPACPPTEDTPVPESNAETPGGSPAPGADTKVQPGQPGADAEPGQADNGTAAGQTDPGRSASGSGPAAGKPGGSGPASSGSNGHAPPNRPGRPAGDRDCADFATQQDAQRYFESIGGSSTNDADRLDENHNGVACESLSDDGDNQDAAVTATGDDGSEATTSGKQVTEVPEGSAQTGGS